jgi:mono/diheme cytochrome c family protein
MTQRAVYRRIILAVAVLLAAASCSRSTDAPGASAEQVLRGAAVYAANCAECHGMRAEGAKDWHRLGPDGKFPPPPLDGSAHAWHHPRAQLKQIILDGTVTRGGGMPAWRGKLSDADVDAIIAWFQSLWPEDIYRAWRELDQKAR